MVLIVSLVFANDYITPPFIIIIRVKVAHGFTLILRVEQVYFSMKGLSLNNNVFVLGKKGLVFSLVFFPPNKGSSFCLSFDPSYFSEHYYCGTPHVKMTKITFAYSRALVLICRGQQCNALG